MRYFFCLLLLPLLSLAQFAPPAGQAGTTAIYKDSSVFVSWASFCVLTRGLQDISNTSGPYASIGDSSNAIGIADNSIVSLGDGGMAVCTFQYPITNGPGADLAIFENSFSDDYLEFAFVEVSSDGINFFRFPATCNIQDTLQTGPFDLSDATKINNLAGKYRALYGTPFDLQELQGISGLNSNAVTHVKIIDVVGSINPAYATYDQNGQKVNDPWPTAFGSGGFDLDAVGVIHDITNSVKETGEETFSVFPNPSGGMQYVELRMQHAELAREAIAISIINIAGVEVKKEIKVNGGRVLCNVNDLVAGMYFMRIKAGERIASKKIIITE